MQVPRSVAGDLDFGAAVTAEARARNRYLPPAVADRALLETQATELEDRLRSRTRRGFEPQLHDSVLARKAGGGSRPLPFMALEDRLMFRALVGSLEPRLANLSFNDDYEEFVRAPLAVSNCKYVLKTDIAAFYQFIDHERLVDEVVAQTGDDLAITATIELLQGGTGRRFGLPQMQDASDVLAEVYVDPIRRDLLRAGYSAVRFADDFRVACSTYSETLAALELVERSAYTLGLVLNESKTTNPQRSTYEASIGDVDRAEDELASLMGPEGVTTDDFFAAALGPYAANEPADVADSDLFTDDGDVPEPAVDTAGDEPTADQIAVANKVLDLWDSDDATEHGWSNAVWSALIRRALQTLESAGETDALDSAVSLLVRQPHLTPQICGYVVSAGREDPERVRNMLDGLCRQDIVSVWQALWIAYAAGEVRGGTRTTGHIQWLRSQLSSAHPSVVAQSALSLARRRLLDVDLGRQAYDNVPMVHRPSVALALAAASYRVGEDFVPNDQLERWLAEWVADKPFAKRLPARRRRKTQKPGGTTS